MSMALLKKQVGVSAAQESGRLGSGRRQRRLRQSGQEEGRKAPQPRQVSF
jgi:hypothetical protein